MLFMDILYGIIHFVEQNNPAAFGSSQKGTTHKPTNQSRTLSNIEDAKQHRLLSRLGVDSQDVKEDHKSG